MPSPAEEGKIYKVKGKHGVYPYFPFGLRLSPNTNESTQGRMDLEEKAPFVIRRCIHILREVTNGGSKPKYNKILAFVGETLFWFLIKRKGSMEFIHTSLLVCDYPQIHRP